ncbi:MAG: hypothetical protein R3F31_08165 [Verrucomicrobiales bacterium]
MALRPVDVGIALAATLQRLHPKQFKLKEMNTLLLDDQVLQGIQEGLLKENRGRLGEGPRGFPDPAGEGTPLLRTGVSLRPKRVHHEPVSAPLQMRSHSNHGILLVPRLDDSAPLKKRVNSCRL